MHTTLKAKDDSLPSRRKVRRTVKTGTRLERSGSGREVEELQVADANADLYVERIVDLDTGTVLRDVCEPLSKHHGGTESHRRTRSK